MIQVIDRPMHLLVPMSGQGTRYQAAGYKDIKPLIPVNGRPMIERLLKSCPAEWRAHFVMADNHQDTKLPEALRKLRPEAKISVVEKHTKGPGLAVLKGLEGIPDEDPVLVSYCDYGMVWDPAHFEEFVRNTGCDACLVSYRGFHAHYLSPQPYAYSRMDGERVVEVREKGSFTPDRENEYASNGAYYFRSARLLREAVEHQFKINLLLNGESYTSLTVQALLEKNPKAHVRVYEIPGFYQWGTPEDLRNFEFWERSSVHAFRFAGLERPKVSQVLMPMAGLGSRFRDVTSLAKPFIPVGGQPMFQSALKTLPQGDRSVVVALKGMAAQLADFEKTGGKVVYLDATPDGQALSTEAGVSALDATGDVLVSSCDHGVAIDPARWLRFRAEPQCDAAIFTIRGFPGTKRRPEAFAYVQAGASPEEFPLVQGVSVKKPLSSTPENDPLLVGTFWFRSAHILNEGIQKLKAKGTRVNGELYLDSVFDILRESGHSVRIFPLDGYLCWGDPDSLAEALYWHEIFGGRSLHRRLRFPGVPA